MIASMANQFVGQLKSIIDDYKNLKQTSKYDDLSDLGQQVAHRLITRSVAAIERASGGDSVYSRQVHNILGRSRENDFGRLVMVIGIAESLAEDIEAGYLSDVSELLHGEIFGDFLQMADHLQAEGYKDAAAVIAGGTLESHLRQLCAKNNVPTETRYLLNKLG